MNPLCTPSEHALSRRQWLRQMGGAAAAGAMGGLVSPAAGEVLKQKEKQVLFIWLDGGMSQLESWDPKPNTQFGGPFRSIPSVIPGVHVSELMPRMAKKLDKICLVRGMHTQDNSHSAGVPRIQRGDPVNRGVIYPYFGSAIAKLLGPTASGLPPYVWVKPGSGGFKPTDAGFLGPKYGSLAFGDGQPPPDLLRPDSITTEQDTARNELRNALNLNYAKPRRSTNTEANSYVFDTAEVLLRQRGIFDTTKYPQKEKDRYGDHQLATGAAKNRGAGGADAGSTSSAATRGCSLSSTGTSKPLDFEGAFPRDGPSWGPGPRARPSLGSPSQSTR